MDAATAAVVCSAMVSKSAVLPPPTNVQHRPTRYSIAIGLR
jgi:hypothetical protein